MLRFRGDSWTGSLYKTDTVSSLKGYVLIFWLSDLSSAGEILPAHTSTMKKVTLIPSETKVILYQTTCLEILRVTYYLGSFPVIRKVERSVAYRVLVGKPEEKWSLGRTRCRWEENIKFYLQEVESVRGMDGIDVAQDNDRWRAPVNAVINFRVPKMWGISWLAEKSLVS